MRSNKINHLGLSLFTAVRIFSLFSMLLFVACSGGGGTTQNEETPNDPTPNNQAPESPSHLTAYALSSSEINLTWYDNSDNETGFVIERGLDNTFDTSDIIETDSNLMSYIDTDLTADTHYFYRIRAINDIGVSTNSDSADCRSNSNNSNPLALTPIARFDVVPYQRISAGETFNLGVIAFSKNGINRVDFNISGQGYTGTNPLISNEMTYNPRTDVHEYWVPLKGSDFATDGSFTVQADVYGKDGGLRNLETFQLLINATGSLPKPEAWVSTSGDNSTGEVGNRSRPFRTIPGAIPGIQASNGGHSDGAVIYLNEGTYSLAGVNPDTNDEWLTITKAAGAVKASTIINGGGAVTTLLKVDGITLVSQGYNQPVLSENINTIWVNDCELIGSGRWTVLSNPVEHATLRHYSTDNYIHDIDYGFGLAAMVRGTTLERLGNDAFANTPFLVNITVRDVDNGTTGWHSDAYQVHTTGTPPAENRIIYNFHATDLHISGLFARSDAGTSTNNAFINMFIEMREPHGVNESDEPCHDSWDMYHNWDHLLIWHCSLPTSNSRFSDLAANSSFIGNLFRQYLDYTTDVDNPEVTHGAPENESNNDFLYNHVMHVYGVTPSAPAQRTPYDIAFEYSLPHWYAKLPDSSASGSATTGSGVVDMSDPGSVNFGRPLNGSVLIDRIPFSTVPADISGNPRDQNPDVGAFEY